MQISKGWQRKTIVFRIIEDGKLVFQTESIQELTEWIDKYDDDDYKPTIVSYGRYDEMTGEAIDTHT